jgi:DNA-directed RNA polymerase specialized sigma24 family protein
VSLTEALRAGAPQAFGALYDRYAGALYAYCYVMVGDEAGDALRDAFITVARHPGAAPGDDAELPVWLHSLARAECVRRGALLRGVVTSASTDPLRRALALLSPEHREVLALSNALDPEETAQVLGVARETAETLVREGQRRLEQAAASVGGRETRDSAMLASLRGEALHRLVTLGYEPPRGQREWVLSSCVAPDGAANTGKQPQLVRGAHAKQGKPSLSRRFLPVVGLVACVIAAATGAALAWPSSHHANETSTLVRQSVRPSRSAQPTPSGDQASPPPQVATSNPGASPTPTGTPAAPTAAAPPSSTAPADGSGSAAPTPPASPAPTAPPTRPAEPTAPAEPTPPAEPAQTAEPTRPTTPPGLPTTRPKPHHTAAPGDAPVDGHRTTGRRSPDRACHGTPRRASRCAQPQPWRPHRPHPWRPGW